jgi:SAM-dependent methyltransferase
MTNIEDMYDKNFFDPEGNKPANYSSYGSYLDNGWFKDQAKRLADTFASEKILDVGCAKGFIVQHLRELGREAYGLDISKYAVSQAPQEIKSFLSCMKIEDLKAEQKYDLVISIETLEHVTDLNKALQKIYNCLKLPGFLWISVPFYAKDFQEGHLKKGDDVTHVNRMTMTEWIKKIESFGFVWMPNIRVGVGEAEKESEMFGIKQKNINEMTFLKTSNPEDLRQKAYIPKFNPAQEVLGI